MAVRQIIRQAAVVEYVYDCDGCGAREITPYSRLQFGQNHQAGEAFRRYLCGECTKHARKFLRRRAEICR